MVERPRAALARMGVLSDARGLYPRLTARENIVYFSALQGMARDEAQAREKFGAVTVFRSEFKALKHTLSGSSERTLMKLIVDTATDRVVGLHMVGAEAGEIVQGFAVAMKAGATKAVFDSTLGIHPTAAEEFVTMRDPVKPG